MQLDVPYVTSISDAAVAIRTTKLDASARSSGKKVTQGSLDKKDGEAYYLLEAIIDAFESVRAALADLESFHPDLLLSDTGMPEEDGYALIRQKRARETATGGTCPRSPSRPLPASPTAKRRWALKAPGEADEPERAFEDRGAARGAGGLMGWALRGYLRASLV